MEQKKSWFLFTPTNIQKKTVLLLFYWELLSKQVGVFVSLAISPMYSNMKLRLFNTPFLKALGFEILPMDSIPLHPKVCWKTWTRDSWNDILNVFWLKLLQNAGEDGEDPAESILNAWRVPSAYVNKDRKQRRSRGRASSLSLSLYSVY